MGEKGEGGAIGVLAPTRGWTRRDVRRAEGGGRRVLVGGGDAFPLA